MSHRLVCHLFVLIRRQSHTLLKLCEIEMFTHCPTSCHPLILNPHPSVTPTASILMVNYGGYSRAILQLVKFSAPTTVHKMSGIAGSFLSVVNNHDETEDSSNDPSLADDVIVRHHNNQPQDTDVDANLNAVDAEVDEEDHPTIQDPLFPFGVFTELDKYIYISHVPDDDGEMFLDAFCIIFEDHPNVDTSNIEAGYIVTPLDCYIAPEYRMWNCEESGVCDPNISLHLPPCSGFRYSDVNGFTYVIISHASNLYKRYDNVFYSIRDDVEHIFDHLYGN